MCVYTYIYILLIHMCVYIQYDAKEKDIYI